MKFRPIPDEPSLIEKEGTKIHHGCGEVHLNLNEFLDQQRRDLIGEVVGLPVDPGFADDLETVNRADQPLKNPWG